MQICHRVCGCVQLLDLANSSIINKSTISTDMTSAYFKETCPIMTYSTSTSPGLIYCILNIFHTLSVEKNLLEFNNSILIYM